MRTLLFATLLALSWISHSRAVAIIDDFNDHSSKEDSGTIALVAGRNYPIRMEYYENGGGAVAQLRWLSPSTAKAVVPKTQLFSGAAPAAPTKHRISSASQWIEAIGLAKKLLEATGSVADATALLKAVEH